MDSAAVEHHRKVLADRKAADRRYEEDRRKEMQRQHEFDLDLKKSEISYQKLQHINRRSQMEAARAVRVEEQEREAAFKKHILETGSLQFEQRRAQREAEKARRKEEEKLRRGAKEESVSVLLRRQQKEQEAEERAYIRKEYIDQVRLLPFLPAVWSRRDPNGECYETAVEMVSAHSWMRLHCDAVCPLALLTLASFFAVLRR